MRRGRGALWAWIATLAAPSLLAAPAFAIVPPRIAAPIPRAPSQIGACRTSGARQTSGLDDERHHHDPPPVTRRSGRSGGDAIEARRDEGRGRRRLPETRIVLAALRRGLRCRGRVPGGIRARRVVAHAAAFYEAHAPPGRLLAVADPNA